MTELTLPPVAKSFHTFCKKCDSDRYHTVLAHTSEKSAKLQCEICKSKKTYTLPKEGAAVKTKKTPAVPGAKKAANAARSHSSQYEILNQNKMADDPIPYSMKTVFKDHQKVNHPKFGIGFVLKTDKDRMDIIFSDEVRTLMQARK